MKWSLGFIYISISFLIFFLGSIVTFAQYEVGTLNIPPYSIRFDGDITPGNTVSTHIEGNENRLSAIRSITWFIGEEEQKLSKTTLSLDVPIANNTIYVTANVVYYNSLGGLQTFQIQEPLNPIIVDILWEGDTVTPPEYLGHKHVGPQAPINITLQIRYNDPTGRTYTEKDFFYKWEKDFTIISQGRGLDTITVPIGNTYIHGFTRINVTFSLTRNNNISFSRTIYIPITTPRILGYIHSPLYGLNTRTAIQKNATILKIPATISVYPYSFSYPDFLSGVIDYTWVINNDQSSAKSGRRVDVNIKGESVSIPFSIKAKNKHGAKSLQTANHNFILSL